jgi:hypothetical protein
MMKMAVDKREVEEGDERSLRKSTKTGETRKGVCYVRWQKRKMSPSQTMISLFSQSSALTVCDPFEFHTR